MTSDPVREALWLYAQLLERGSAPDEGALALASKIVAMVTEMGASDRQRYYAAAKRLRDVAIRDWNKEHDA